MVDVVFRLGHRIGDAPVAEANDKAPEPATAAAIFEIGINDTRQGDQITLDGHLAAGVKVAEIQLWIDYGFQHRAAAVILQVRHRALARFADGFAIP